MKDERDFATLFGQVLRRHRTEKGLSQEKLAELADLHPTYIGLVERGLRNPSLNVAASLAAALKEDLSLLIVEVEQLSN